MSNDQPHPPTCERCGRLIRAIRVGVWVHDDPQYDPFAPPIHAPVPVPDSNDDA